jgi:pimeloyl-ACP methyl ester carboxylesterase
MFSRVAGIRTSFQEAGTGPAVVLLHGWGGDSRSFWPVYQALTAEFHVLAPDLPGFGRSALPPAAWGVGDYAEHLRQWLDERGLERIALVGHSFGGRVAIVFAARWPERVTKLVLVASAGIRPRRTPLYYLKVCTARLGRRLLALSAFARTRPRLERWLYTALGATDYQQAGPLRSTLVRVVNEDLRPLLPTIMAPTLLIWGDRDAATPLADGRTMSRLLPNARLIVYPGAGHFAYLERTDQFIRDLRAFLGAP